MPEPTPSVTLVAIDDAVACDPVTGVCVVPVTDSADEGDVPVS